MTARVGDAPRRALTVGRVDVKRARLLLAALVLASSAFAIRYHDGHDFVNNVWAPVHGLLAGYNPYDPADVEYYLRYQVPVVAGLYLPTALLVHSPLALVKESRSADIMAALDALLIWLGVLLLIPPRTFRACTAAGFAGTLIVLSAPAQDTVFLGQLSAAAFAGLALLVASLRSDPSARWLPAVGVALVALKPQSAIPILVALAVLKESKVLARAGLILAATSLPGALLFLRVNPAPSAVIATITSNLNHLSNLPPNDLTNAANIRIDALGILSHLGGPALSGFAWTGVTFAVATVLLVAALRAMPLTSRALPDPNVVSVVTLYIVVSLIHLSYDQLILYTGSLTALYVITESERPSHHSHLIALGGIVLAAVGLFFRSGIRALMIEVLSPVLPIYAMWLCLPTLVVLGVVAIALMLDRHCSMSKVVT